MKKISKKYIIGIDEVGRGPIAGPVSLGLVMIEKKNINILKGVLDSKKLSQKKREEWFQKLKKFEGENKLVFSNTLVGSYVVDDMGIVPAIKIGIKKCLKKVGANKDETFIYLDGALCAPEKFYQETVIKGDEKIPIVGAASIVAKVLRDRFMIKMSLKHPEYGFERHKGYGTQKHYQKIKKFGLTELHRKSFIH